MKAVLLYLVLVGVPLLGLLGILRVGEGLHAPAFVDGDWSIDPRSAQLLPGSCVPFELPAGEPEMSLSQSGRYVQVRFNDAARTSMAARLDDDTLTVRHVFAARGELACGPSVALVVRLAVRRTSGAPEQLEGHWMVPECDACPPRPFRAVRTGGRVDVDH